MIYPVGDRDQWCWQYQKVSARQSGKSTQQRLWKRDKNNSKMVYYFTSNVVDPSAFVYVGKDKVESKSLFINFERNVMANIDDPR